MRRFDSSRPRALNAAVHFDAEELIATARADTGLEDFGGESFREGLEVLCRSLSGEARLTPAGGPRAREYLLRLLGNRLQIEQWWRTHPELEAEEVRAPIFVLGLPRTGTTALSALLARDPDTRSLRTWESGAPVPPPETATEHSDPRIAATQAGMDAMHAEFPLMRIMYDAEATSPSECQDLLGMEFRAQHFAGSYRVPGFAAWQLDCDMVPAYRYHRRTLQMLQSRCPPRRWHLKTPVHMLSLDALVEIYPDARFVMTHRDPAKVLGSVCSLIRLVSSMACEGIDPVELGREQVELWAEALRRAIDFRERAGEARFADLPFREQLADPIAAVQRAYSRLGIPFTDAAREQMQAWASEHRRGRLGEHRYDLAEFGLDPDRIRERYAFYMQRFDVEPGV